VKLLLRSSVFRFPKTEDFSVDVIYSLFFRPRLPPYNNNIVITLLTFPNVREALNDAVIHRGSASGSVVALSRIARRSKVSSHGHHKARLTRLGRASIVRKSL